MKLDTRELQGLTKSQFPPAFEILARTFWNCPVSLHHYPDEWKRERGLTVFLEFILRYCLRYDAVYTTSQDLGELPSGCPRSTF